MRIKKYTAPSMRECLDLMRSEIGEEAVLLSTKDIIDQNGSSVVEVIAGIDPRDLPKKLLVPNDIQFAAGESAHVTNQRKVHPRTIAGRITDDEHDTSSIPQWKHYIPIDSEEVFTGKNTQHKSETTDEDTLQQSHNIVDEIRKLHEVVAHLLNEQIALKKEISHLRTKQSNT